MQPEAFCAEHGIAALYLFGSRARGDATPESDFDLAVVLDRPERARDARERRALSADLDGLFDGHADVAFLDVAPVLFADHILREAELVVDLLPDRRRDLEERILQLALDFRLDDRLYQREAEEAIRDGHFFGR